MKSGITEGNVIYPDKNKTRHWSNYSNSEQDYSMADIRLNENVFNMGPNLILRFVKDTAKDLLDKKDSHDF